MTSTATVRTHTCISDLTPAPGVVSDTWLCFQCAIKKASALPGMSGVGSTVRLLAQPEAASAATARENASPATTNLSAAHTHTHTHTHHKIPIPRTSLTGCVQAFTPPSKLIDGLWDYSIVETVDVPAGLPAGDYVLSWRWVTEQLDSNAACFPGISLTDCLLMGRVAATTVCFPPRKSLMGCSWLQVGCRGDTSSVAQLRRYPDRCLGTQNSAEQCDFIICISIYLSTRTIYYLCIYLLPARARNTPSPAIIPAPVAKIGSSQPPPCRSAIPPSRIGHARKTQSAPCLCSPCACPTSEHTSSLSETSLKSRGDGTY